MHATTDMQPAHMLQVSERAQLMPECTAGTRHEMRVFEADAWVHSMERAFKLLWELHVSFPHAPRTAQQHVVLGTR